MPLERTGGMPTDDGAGRADGIRMLVAAKGPRAERIERILADFRRLVWEANIEIEAAAVVAEIARARHEVYILADRLDATSIAALFPDELPDVSDRVVVVVVGPGEPLDKMPAGVVAIDEDELSAAVLERAIELAMERTMLSSALAASEQRYALTVAAANDGLWHWDVRADTCTFAPRWKTLLGYAEGELSNEPREWFDRVHPDDIDALRANIKAHLDGLTPVHEFEHRVKHKNGRWRWVLSRGLSHRDEWGRATQMAGSLTDISRRKAFEHRLQHDSVTGLASRMTLMERLATTIETSKRKKDYGFAVLFLNLDRFKVVNDSIGLESGDRVLSQLGERLLGCVGSNHLVCRYGGDEFAILMENLDDFAEADRVSRAIHDALTRPFNLDGHEVFTTVSVGITRSSMGYDRPADVIRDVGVAINEAKRTGKGRTVTFDTHMRLEAVSQLRLQTAIRQAVDREEFEVHYQPIVSLETLQLTGFEALVRWRHPRRGIVPPDEFIPLAEETGLIIPVGRFVMNEACRQMAIWREQLPLAAELSVSVNLSGKQIGEGHLIDVIEQSLEDCGLPAAALKLELTESTLIDDADGARDLIGALRDRGVRLYIDDFGTGYSSLTYLHTLAVDGLKIDKSFVEMVGLPERRSAIVPSIVSLAHSLGMSVVAEGVETVRQRNALRELRCGEAQGYLFSRPLDAKAAEALIARGHV